MFKVMIAKENVKKETRLKDANTLKEATGTHKILHSFFWGWCRLCDMKLVKMMKRFENNMEKSNIVSEWNRAFPYIAYLVKGIMFLPFNMKDDMCQIYHYSNEGVCSWYDFAWQIMKLSGLSCRINAIESAQYPTKAKRPFYSVLNKSKIKTLGIEIPHWQESLEKCLKKF